MSARLYDDGAQVERTSLAWTRTGLAMLVGTLLAARMTAHRLGAVAIIVAAVACAATIASLMLARRRYRRAHHTLQSGHGELPDGRLPALVATVALLLGAIELTYMLSA